MNWLLIIIVLLLALCVVNGYRKGFLRMMYSMVSWVIMFVLVTWATPYINTFLRIIRLYIRRLPYTVNSRSGKRQRNR